MGDQDNKAPIHSAEGSLMSFKIESYAMAFIVATVSKHFNIWDFGQDSPPPSSKHNLREYIFKGMVLLPCSTVLETFMPSLVACGAPTPSKAVFSSICHPSVYWVLKCQHYSKCVNGYSGEDGFSCFKCYSQISHCQISTGISSTQSAKNCTVIIFLYCLFSCFTFFATGADTESCIITAVHFTLKTQQLLIQHFWIKRIQDFAAAIASTLLRGLFSRCWDTFFIYTFFIPPQFQYKISSK